MPVDTQNSTLRYEEIAPPRAIAGWVEAMWWIRGQTGEELFWHDVLPDGCADWIISADGGGVKSVFVGPMTQRLQVPVQGRANSFGIRFRPGGLAGIAQTPLAEVRDDHLHDLPFRIEGGAELVDAVAGETPPDQLVNLAVQTLTQWHGTSAGHGLNAQAVRAIAAYSTRHDNMTVSQIAAQAGMSVRTLRRVFDSTVGLSPKFFARVMRVQETITMMASAHTTMNWAVAAASAGYSDQAHLVREFREFTGWTPAAYWAAMKNGRFLQYKISATC